MTKFFPQRAANDITKILRQVGKADYPLDVRKIASEISRAKTPDDPISIIKGENLPGLEGMLIRAPSGKKGWGIFYNNAISSQGRINFTLGHEFGHYVLHRAAYPDGFQCDTEDLAKWESEFGQREHEANMFAATLLMPLDDFRAQISARERPTLNQIVASAHRYGVSLIAATLRWLQYTSQPAMLVVSRDGYVLWARSSKRAFKSGLFFRTRNPPPIKIPAASVASKLEGVEGQSNTVELDSGVWLGQQCTEQVLVSPQYDFILSLLHFNPEFK